ncbi:MAG TPA: ExsB family protein [Pseudothermotoga sp.]
MQQSSEGRIQEIVDKIVLDIKTTVQGKLLVAFSGGEDSSLAAFLSKQALGKDRVTLVTVDWGPFTYNAAKSGVVEAARSLDLDLIFVDGHIRQSQIWCHGPSCNMCTRFAKLQSVLDVDHTSYIATGSNLSDSWGQNGIKINGRLYSPLIDLDKKTIRLLIEYLGIKPMKIGESTQREGCKLKHLLKMMINFSYHGKAVSCANEILLSFLKEINHETLLANVKIIGSLSKNIALVNVLPHLGEQESDEIVRRLSAIDVIDEVHVLKDPVKLKVLANPGLFNESLARTRVFQGFIQKDFAVPVSAEWYKSSNSRLRTFQVVGFEYDNR